MKKNGSLWKYLGNWILLLIVAHLVLLTVLVLIVKGTIDIPFAFNHVASLTITVSVCLIITAVICLLSRNSPCRDWTGTNGNEWQNTRRSFVLWTLLVHGRHTDDETPGERVLQDKKMHDVCKKMTEVLTDDDFSLLAGINPAETAEALRLLEKYNPKKE